MEVITLLCGFPQSRSPLRISEFDHCLSMNLKNPCIDRMVILLEENGPRRIPDLEHEHRVEVRGLSRRSTFQDYIDAANEIAHGGVAVFSNADIWFDWSVDKLRFIPERTLCAITRSDYTCNLWSSDAWAFRPPLELYDCNWWLGRCGCENAFTSAVYQSLEWRLWNPFRSVKLHHAHRSNIRFEETRTKVSHDPTPFPIPVLFNEKSESFEECGEMAH